MAPASTSHDLVTVHVADLVVRCERSQAVERAREGMLSGDVPTREGMTNVYLDAIRGATTCRDWRGREDPFASGRCEASLEDWPAAPYEREERGDEPEPER